LSDPTTGNPVKSWQSHPNGVYDAQAQNIIFDIPIAGDGSPTGGQSIIVEGVSLADLTKANQYAGLQFQLSAGMAPGLPLANPLQQGVIASGVIFQSFGHWEGTEMSVAFVCYPDEYTLQNPGNIVLSWKVGQSLQSALNQTYSTAYPNVPIAINISPSLVAQNDETGYFPSRTVLGQWVKSITSEMGSEVTVAFQNGKINISDSTYSPSPIQIDFTDLVGQPTWLDVNNMQAKMVMRGDISINSLVLMPQGMIGQPGFVMTLQASLPSSMKYQSTFQDQFRVSEMRHIGNFRSPEGASWSTIINALPI
jgi:hypothetical protein